MVEYLPCMYVRNHGSESHLRQLFFEKGKVGCLRCCCVVLFTICICLTTLLSNS